MKSIEQLARNAAREGQQNEEIKFLREELESLRAENKTLEGILKNISLVTSEIIFHRDKKIHDCINDFYKLANNAIKEV